MLDYLTLEVGLTGAAHGVAQGGLTNVLLNLARSIGDGHYHGAQAGGLAFFTPLHG
jgi:hypothetical protein